MKNVNNWILLLVVVAILPLVGCSTFNRDWKAAAAKSPSPNSIEGAWDGTWSSEPSGHTGRLRCVMEKLSDTSYRARFDSTYKKILKFKSTVVLDGVMTNGVFRFSGEAQLPKWAGGLYRYEGETSSTNFYSTYQCEYDHGIFQMKRP